MTLSDIYRRHRCCASIFCPADDRTCRRGRSPGAASHYWQLDLERRRLKVYVRSGKEYRHAETIGPATRTWADFGVGLVLLDLPDLLDFLTSHEP